MKTKYYSKSEALFRFQGPPAWALLLMMIASPLLSSCGNTDAEPIVKKFCSGVKSGESIQKVFQRAGEVEFDKYWLEKYGKAPGEGDVLGIIRPRDLEKNSEKLEKLKAPETWEHGQFKAMIQEFGYSRYVCSVDFSRDKVLRKKTYSLD